MRPFRYLSILLLCGITGVCAFAQQNTVWPPESKGIVDTMNLRMTVIKGLPDSVAVRNPLIFIDKIDEDEYDLYVLNKYLRNIFVRTTMISPNPDIRGRAKAYARVMLVDLEGKEIKTITTNQGGSANFNLEEMKIPDGFYRVRVDYGNRYTKSGTKPKSRLELHVTPRVSMPKPVGGQSVPPPVPPMPPMR